MRSTSFLLTSEHHFNHAMAEAIRQLWQQRNEGRLRSRDGKQLYWASLTSPEHTKAILVVNGRIESVWKYQELLYDLYQNGYDVYAFDHRGQGLSDRTVSNQHIGHVHNFSDYILDLHSLVQHFPLERYQQRFLLCHSMGGAVAARYLQQHPQHPFDGIAMSAPMFGVNMAWYLKPVSTLLSGTLSLLQREPGYATRNREYFAKPFANNPLSQSHVRYQWFRQLYEEFPELKIGGPSSRWAYQSLKAARQCIREADKIRIPLLLLQAGEDIIVSNQDQQLFMQRLHRYNSRAELVTIPGARHELFFEQDKYRDETLHRVLHFFANLA